MKRFTRKHPLLLIGIAVAVTLIIVSACGGGEEPTPTPEPVPPTPTVAPTEPPHVEATATPATEIGEAAATQSEATLSLVPTEDGSAVEIWVYEIEELYALDLELAFEPDSLSFVDADDKKEGIQIEAGEVPVSDFVVSNEVDESEGKIYYTVAQIAPREPYTGDGLVARINLQDSAEEITLSVVKALLADKSGGEIAVATP